MVKLRPGKRNRRAAMDGIKIKEDFEEFISEHPKVIIKRGGHKLFITKELSTFCHKYNYPLDYVRGQLKKLGIITGRTTTVWIPEEKEAVYCYILNGDQSFLIDDLVKEARQIIEQAPKIVWRDRTWIRKQHLLSLCEKYELTYNILLKILRKHGLIIGARKIYDAEATELILAVEIPHNNMGEQIVKKARELLKDKAFNGKVITQRDLLFLAKDIGMGYKGFINLMKENGLIENHMVVFKMKEINDERDGNKK
jgi:phage antirepressor YoqD-like protein